MRPITRLLPVFVLALAVGLSGAHAGGGTNNPDNTTNASEPGSTPAGCPEDMTPVTDTEGVTKYCVVDNVDAGNDTPSPLPPTERATPTETDEYTNSKKCD